MTIRKARVGNQNRLMSIFLSVCMAAPIVGFGASCRVLSDAEGGSGYWSQTTRWKDGQIPNDGDDINIYSSITATDADMAILRRGKYVVTRGAAVTLTIDVESDYTVSGEIDGNGACIKTGAGRLTLDKMNHQIAGGITVESGELALANSCKATRISAKQGGTVFIESANVSVVTLDIQAPSIAYLPETGNLSVGGLAGDGALLRRPSAAAGYQQVIFIGASDGRAFDFSGDVSPTIAFTTSAGSSTKCNQHLLGNASASTQDLRFQDGVLGITKFGSASNPGSFGSGTAYMQCKGLASAPTFLYLGSTGETTARKFCFTSNPLGEMTFDAGAFGGLSLTGEFGLDTTSDDSMMRMALTGSNIVNACRLEATFNEPDNAAVYMTKRGSGIWRFPATSASKAKYKGVFAVEAGTLEYESLAEAGSWCSLGYATVLHECYSGARDDTRAVPYAYLLGSGGAASDPDLATFSYVGSSDVDVTSRPIALKGAARVKNATAQRFALSGVTSAQTGRNDLVLDGTGYDNVIFNVTNGIGSVGLVKEGMGMWTLDGQIDVTGGVTVKEGMLNLRPADTSRMTWFRFTVRKNCSNETQTVLCHLGLFDAQHNDLALGITYNADANGRVHACLRPGQAAFESADCAGGQNGMKNDMDNLFKPYERDYTARWSRGNVAPDPNRPTTWPSLVIRLPENVTAPVVAYDMITGWYDGADKPFKWTPTDWTMEGSVDGVTWAPLPLDEKAGWTRARNGDNYWLSDATVCTGVSSGFAIGTTTGSGIRTLAIGALAVAPGATLAVAGAASVSEWDLASGAGTVTGVSFAETGTLKVAIPASARQLYAVPCALQDCTGLVNLKRWTLLVNGEPTTKWSFVRASGNEMIFSTGGFIISIR